MRTSTAFKAVATLVLAGLPSLDLAGGIAGPSDPSKVVKRLAMTKNAERDLVKRTVADGEAQRRLLALYDERDRLVAEHLQAIEAYRDKMRTLDADYHATLAMFETVISDYGRERAAWQKEFAELLAAMKRETTAREWKVISDFELRKFRPRELAYPEPERER